MDQNRNRILLFRPRLRITTTNSLELIIQLENQSSMTLPKSLLLMTADRKFFKLSFNLTAQKFIEQNHHHHQHLIYAVQQKNPDENDFYETIEQKIHYNYSSFYTDNLLETFQNYRHQTAKQQQQQRQKLCQLFIGHQMINNNSNDNLTATITICTDGSMVSLFVFVFVFVFPQFIYFVQLEKQIDMYLRIF